jgi:hypothetical protein
VGVHAVSEKPYELAYEASIRAIDNQAATVESLRSRAGTILAATALAVSLLSLTILLPFRLRFSLRARAILSFFEEEAEDGPRRRCRDAS